MSGPSCRGPSCQGPLCAIPSYVLNRELCYSVSMKEGRSKKIILTSVKIIEVRAREMKSSFVKNYNGLVPEGFEPLNFRLSGSLLTTTPNQPHVYNYFIFRSLTID